MPDNRKSTVSIEFFSSFHPIKTNVLLLAIKQLISISISTKSLLFQVSVGSKDSSSERGTASPTGFTPTGNAANEEGK